MSDIGDQRFPQPADRPTRQPLEPNATDGWVGQDAWVTTGGRVGRVGGLRGVGRLRKDERGVVPVPTLELFLQGVHHLEHVASSLGDLVLLAD
jgi:hypothetical protein